MNLIRLRVEGEREVARGQGEVREGLMEVEGKYYRSEVSPDSSLNACSSSCKMVRMLLVVTSGDVIFWKGGLPYMSVVFSAKSSSTTGALFMITRAYRNMSVHDR